jgi:hypothetical protein
MKTKLSSLTLIAFCTFLVFTASNCKEKERKTIYVDSETKAYCDFKTGSWWAYKEEQTGLLDAITVYDYNPLVSEKI